MDIARGSRRARQVAANANANASASAGAGAAQQPPGAPQRAPAAHGQDDLGGLDEEPQRRAAAAAHRHRLTPETRQTTGLAAAGGDLGEGTAAVAPHPFRLHRAAYAGPRLSMPEISDDSGSEPDLSVLGMVRGVVPEQPALVATYEDEIMSQEPDEDDDTSLDEQSEAEQDEGEVEDDEESPPLVDPTTVGLKEISNLGKFTVSSHKQGSGVEELRSDDLKLYWQSDGPQPHKLTVYFVKRVGIRDIRFYVDYNEDESYTPAKIIFKSGISENNLIEFATMNLSSPVGWQQVPLAGAGGEPDGNTLVSYVLQMQILENHQNGKDTHLRGIKIYAFDADATGKEAGARGRDGTLDRVVHLADQSALAGDVADDGDSLASIARALAESSLDPTNGVFSVPDFTREPELR